MMSHATLRLITAGAQKFSLSRNGNLVRPRDMKCAAAIIIVSIAFASQALAVLRPLFPAKATPPFSGEAIVTGNRSVSDSAKQASDTAPR
jgi:hypothetical protein